MNEILRTGRSTTAMKDKRNSIRAGSMILTAIILPSFGIAQDPGPCPDCPIDGGLIILLVIGLIYGVMKYRQARKLAKEN